MEPEGSLPHSQVPTTCPSSEPARSSPYPPHPTSWRSILILPSHLRLCLPGGFFPSGFPNKTSAVAPKEKQTVFADYWNKTISTLFFLTSPQKISWNSFQVSGAVKWRRKDRRTGAANGPAVATFDCERAKKVGDDINKRRRWTRIFFVVTTCASRVGTDRQTDRLLRFTRSQATCHGVLSPLSFRHS